MGNSESSEQYSPKPNSSESQLVAAAFSAAFKRPVVTQEEYERRKSEPQFARVETLDLQKIADLSYEPVAGKFGDVYGESGRKITVFLRSLNGRQIKLKVGVDSYVEEVKYLLEEKEGFTVANDSLVLLCNDRWDRSLPVRVVGLLIGYPLWGWRGRRVMEDGHRISEYGVEDMDVIEFTGTLQASGPSTPLVLNENDLDHAFNYDFSGMTDDGTKFTRGGRDYYRPYGWKRFALKVHGKYEDDTWLGEGGYRTDSSRGEWPVSYHGTKRDNVKGIAEEGYLLSKGKSFAFGVGIYSAPSIEVAADYAETFNYQDKPHKVVFQNRVSASGLKEISQNHGIYWLQEKQKLIRPYGVCIKEM